MTRNRISAAIAATLALTGLSHAARAQPIWAGGGPTYCYASIKAAVTSCGSVQAHTIVGYSVGNENNSAPSFVQLFNKAPGSVTLGTTLPDLVIPMPSGLGRERTGISILFNQAITFACTTTETGSTAPTGNCDIRFDYQ